jgi:hypothetical protein
MFRPRKKPLDSLHAAEARVLHICSLPTEKKKTAVPASVLFSADAENVAGMCLMANDILVCYMRRKDLGVPTLGAVRVGHGARQNQTDLKAGAVGGSVMWITHRQIILFED